MVTPVMQHIVKGTHQLIVDQVYHILAKQNFSFTQRNLFKIVIMVGLFDNLLFFLFSIIAFSINGFSSLMGFYCKAICLNCAISYHFIRNTNKTLVKFSGLILQFLLQKTLALCMYTNKQMI